MKSSVTGTADIFALIGLQMPAPIVPAKNDRFCNSDIIAAYSYQWISSVSSVSLAVYVCQVLRQILHALFRIIIQGTGIFLFPFIINRP